MAPDPASIWGPDWGSRPLRPGERQTSLVELAQLWHRVAEEEERGTFAEGAATAVAPKPGRPRHSSNSKSAQKRLRRKNKAALLNGAVKDRDDGR